jgi:hypothetical protein
MRAAQHPQIPVEAAEPRGLSARGLKLSKEAGLRKLHIDGTDRRAASGFFWCTLSQS